MRGKFEKWRTKTNYPYELIFSLRARSKVSEARKKKKTNVSKGAKLRYGRQERGHNVVALQNSMLVNRCAPNVRIIGSSGSARATLPLKGRITPSWENGAFIFSCFCFFLYFPPKVHNREKNGAHWKGKLNFASSLFAKLRANWQIQT